MATPPQNDPLHRTSGEAGAQSASSQSASSQSASSQSASSFNLSSLELGSAGDRPANSQPTAQAVVRAGKARPFYGRHPWVLDKAIATLEPPFSGTSANSQPAKQQTPSQQPPEQPDRSTEGSPRVSPAEGLCFAPVDGDVVDLVAENRKFIARGILNTQSKLRVRLYSWQQEALDASFWNRHLEAALRLREQNGLLAGPEAAARLVFSEGDGLSGLIVDRYADYLAVQVTSLGIAKRLGTVFLPALVSLFRPQGIFLRTERGTARSEGVRFEDGLVWGTAPDGPVFISEHGIRYGVDVAAGQKTGFYLDQRENRLQAAGYLAGRRVLDVFCYTGAFSLVAARHGPCVEVLGLDSSPKAVALAQANAQLNNITQVRFQSGDAFEALEQRATAGEKFGGVILDPPKFCRSRHAVDDALRAYHRINRLAVELLEAEGILVTCSCSGHVLREDFLAMLSGVSQKSGRQIQVLEQRGAGVDHPVHVSCPETEYLKCFVCRVI